MILNSNAKINLGLKVYGKRPLDLYHYISTIMIPISFGDVIEIEENEKDELICVNQIPIKENKKLFDEISGGVGVKNNLIWKVLDKTKNLRKKSFIIKLTKKIPLGAGLGGGSSNAGVILSYFFKNKILSPNFTKENLFELALELGTDVPFFLFLFLIEQKPCFIYGIGEKFEEIKIAKGFGVLCLSDININTAYAYNLLKRSLQETPLQKFSLSLDDSSLIETSQSLNIKEEAVAVEEKIQYALKKANWGKLSALLKNDFEEVIFSKFESLKFLSEKLKEEDVEYVQMSGSGSTLYALLSSEKKTLPLCQKLQSNFPNYSFVPFSFQGNIK